MVLCLLSAGTLQVPADEREIDRESSVLGRDYWAVLAGIGDYAGTTTDLPYSVAEVTAIEQTLLAGGNWNASHILVLTDKQVTREALLLSLEWLSEQADDDDLTLFYYAGHGGKSSTNEYLILYDDSLSDSDLDSALDAVQGTIVVMIDSCYSGGFAEELGERGRVILTACKKTEKTYQVQELNSGIFGYFVNLSLGWFAKSAEATYFFTWFLSVSYSTKLSKEYEQDYVVHPVFYDGTWGRTKLINHHPFIDPFVLRLLNRPLNKEKLTLWHMASD